MGIKYLDEPKTSSRIKYLDERPSQTFLKAGKEVSEQDFLSPGKLHIQSPLLAAAKGASDVIGGPFAPNYYASRIPKFIGGQGLAHPEAMRYAGEVSRPLEEAKIEGIPGQIGYGLAQVAPILAGGPAPFMAGAKGLLGVASKIPIAGRLARAPIAKTALGFGGYEAVKGLVGGEADIVKSFGEGVVGGAGYHAGLRGGATLGKMLLPTKIAERVGSAAGAGAVGALTAPEGEKVSSALVGAGFGVKYPGRAFGYKTPVELSKQAVDIYRNILRPTQAETQLIEVRKGKDLDNYFKLAAEENLPIKKTSENKLDTEQAREILQGKIKTTQSELDKILEKDTTNYFDLLKIEQQAKKSAKEQISNAKELETANQQIEDYISAEIARHKGRTVSAASLNRIKQGMWSVGYDALRPTSQENARRIGFATKDAIEKAYPNNIVRTLNDKSGDYITLSRLLEKAHGRVIQKGRIGGYAAKGTGLIIGGAAGQLIPVPGVGMAAGAWAGQKIGGKINEYLSSPERLSKVAGKKMAESKSLGKEQLLDVAFKNLTKSPVFIPKTKSFSVQTPRQIGAKLKGKSGQAVFGREEPQEPVFGGIPPSKDLLGKPGIVEGKPLTAAEAVKKGMGKEEYIANRLKESKAQLEKTGDRISSKYYYHVSPTEQIGGIKSKPYGAEKSNVVWLQKGQPQSTTEGFAYAIDPSKVKVRTAKGNTNAFVHEGDIPKDAIIPLGKLSEEGLTYKGLEKKIFLSEYEAAKPLTAQQAVKQGMGAEEWVGAQGKKIYRGDAEKIIPIEQYDVEKGVRDMGKDVGSAFSEGPGIYFSTGKQVARGYAGGKEENITEAIFPSSGNLLTPESKNLPAAKIKALLKNINKETMDIALSNYDENPVVAKNMLIKSIMNSENAIDQLMTIWSDVFYHQRASQFMDMATKSGIDGLKIPRGTGEDYFVVYNRGILKTKSKLLSEYEAAKGARGKGKTLGLAGLTAAGTIMAGQAQAEEKKNVLEGEVSTYGWDAKKEHLNERTANNEKFDPNGLTAAMWDIPFGTKVKVTDKKTGKTVIVRINDRGPAKRLNRPIDLSRGAWKALGYEKPGLIQAKIEILKAD